MLFIVWSVEDTLYGDKLTRQRGSLSSAHALEELLMELAGAGTAVGSSACSSRTSRGRCMADGSGTRPIAFLGDVFMSVLGSLAGRVLHTCTSFGGRMPLVGRYPSRWPGHRKRAGRVRGTKSL